MTPFTLILPYYDQPGMLRRQIEEWRDYPDEVRIIVVDDGSPEHPAADVMREELSSSDRERIRLARMLEDIPWNRNCARNLGTHLCLTDWMLHTDIDHVLTGRSARELLTYPLRPSHWYRLARFRIGKADETRQKDALPDDAEFGPVKPHVDSFLCHKTLWARAGGYDEDFSGSLGGSSLFLKHMEQEGGPAVVLDDIRLHVHTRDSVPDSSEHKLSRDRSRYERIREEKRRQGDPKPGPQLRVPWEEVRW